MPNVLITGANRGLGLALATRFAARTDTHVFATARDAHAATELAALRAHDSSRIDILSVDVTDSASIDEFARALAARDVVLDVLINNAARANWNDLGAIVDSEIAEIFCTNAIGPVLVTQALLGCMRGGGKIVNITSILGSVQLANGTGGIAYPMSKAALNMFSKTLAVDLRARGIAVLALHPGWVRTRMGGDEATLSVDESADGMMRVIDDLGAANSGSYLTYAGETLPW